MIVFVHILTFKVEPYHTKIPFIWSDLFHIDLLMSLVYFLLASSLPSFLSTFPVAFEQNFSIDDSS